MKLILAVVEDDDATVLMDALIEEKFSVTKLASTGGFLLRGNTTLLIGVDADQVERVLHIIRKTCVRRKKLMPQAPSEIPTTVAMPIEAESGGAAVWVVDVDQFHRI